MRVRKSVTFSKYLGINTDRVLALIGLAIERLFDKITHKIKLQTSISATEKKKRMFLI